MYVIPAAYAKPAPIDPGYFRKTTRDTVLVSLAGPIATLVLGILAGLAGARRLVAARRGVPVRVGADVHEHGAGGLPPAADPGLDGARIVALLLPPQAREVYRNADKYLPLFVLVVLFVFSTLVLGFLTALTGALCNAAASGDCQRLLLF